jgi:CelD/BcsL family acetyltransferase involved in cellulose biosynthesis
VSGARGRSIPVADRGGNSEADARAAVKQGAGRSRVLVVRGVEAIEPFVDDWDALARSALEPNVFYEPWMCLAALRSVTRDGDLELVLVQRDGGALVGVFPLVRQVRYRGVPAVTLRMWKHDYCYLATPLVDRVHAAECIHAFLDWVREESGALLFELGGISGDGPFHHALIDAINKREELLYLVHRESRGLLRARADADEYFAAALDGNARRKLRSKEKALASAGSVEYVELASADEAPAWAAQFMAIEDSGWKGRGATALASRPADRDFFEAAVTDAARRKQLMMLALRVDGRTVAMKCNFLCGEGSFAFKIAYDETHARSSPGMLLELENIRRVHAMPGLRWMDSCARPSSRLFRELWIDRRTIETLLIPARREPGGLIVSVLPLARWMTRRARGSVAAAASALRRNRVRSTHKTEER